MKPRSVFSRAPLSILSRVWRSPFGPIALPIMPRSAKPEVLPTRATRLVFQIASRCKHRHFRVFVAMERRDSADADRHSPLLDRNPSPPPEDEEEEEEEEEKEAAGEADAIGGTVYSKHWLFSALSRLVQLVSAQDGGSVSCVQLTDDLEDDLCKVWDMAADEDVTLLLQEFKTPDILLAVIAASQSPRLTEICVGILGNMACFPAACASLSQNSDLSDVLLLLLGDSDPPTLLETCRLVLTCLSQPDVAPLWLERVWQRPALRSGLCFIMRSSTNADLLLKVGELVDKLFEEDEELMKSWASAADGQEGVAWSLLEAARQLRAESPEALEVFLHCLQTLSTEEESVQALVSDEACGPALWEFVRQVLCEDLCRPDDPPLVLQEQKALLTPAVDLLSVLHAALQTDTDGELLQSLLRILRFYTQLASQEPDLQLAGLIHSTAQLFSTLVTSNDTLLQDELRSLARDGHVTAVRSLLPDHVTALLLPPDTT